MIYNRTEESNKVFNNFLNSYFFENFKIKPSILESQGITLKFIEFFFSTLWKRTLSNRIK